LHEHTTIKVVFLARNLGWSNICGLSNKQYVLQGFRLSLTDPWNILNIALRAYEFSHPDIMTRQPSPLVPTLLSYYYAATAVFVLLDYLLNINVRVAFLQDWPNW